MIPQLEKTCSDNSIHSTVTVEDEQSNATKQLSTVPQDQQQEEQEDSQPRRVRFAEHCNQYYEPQDAALACPKTNNKKPFIKNVFRSSGRKLLSSNSSSPSTCDLWYSGAELHEMKISYGSDLACLQANPKVAKPFKTLIKGFYELSRPNKNSKDEKKAVKQLLQDFYKAIGKHSEWSILVMGMETRLSESVNKKLQEGRLYAWDSVQDAQLECQQGLMEKGDLEQEISYCLAEQSRVAAHLAKLVAQFHRD